MFDLTLFVFSFFFNVKQCFEILFYFLQKIMINYINVFSICRFFHFDVFFSSFSFLLYFRGILMFFFKKINNLIDLNLLYIQHKYIIKFVKFF